MKYHIIRSNRKTVALHIKNDLTIEVRCPQEISDEFVETFVRSKSNWIEKAIEKQSNMIVLPLLKINELEALRRMTREKVKRFLSDFTGEKPDAIVVRKQISVWGTCSSAKKLSINAYAGILPESLFEYVMIHELSHLVYMNHSPDFWKLVSYYIPDWNHRRNQLKQYRFSR